MYPNEGESIVPAALLRPGHVVFDMVYRPRDTRLIQDATARGCTVIHGLEMLANQAELQFERWMGVPAPRGVMRQALVDALAQG
jgi:shikimate dehydrogenase